VLVIVFFPHQLIRRSPVFLDDGMEILGVSLVLLGQLLRVSARGHKAENSGNGHKLIQSGPYSMVRNPMYLGIILIGMGAVFFVMELWVAVLFGLLLILRYWELLLTEERFLLKEFGQEYAEYKNKVPRLFPTASFILKKDIRNYLPLKLAWFKRESVSIIIVLAVALLIEFREELRECGWHGIVQEAFILVLVGVLYFGFVLFLIKHDEEKTV
jgi:protein-S-isoprenylcysteine O-methyltransferase Ste14